MEETRNDGDGENVEHDQISSLPNEVLSHILSFLSTKEAVHTCVLSKRWRKMWAIVPVLDFNICEFLMYGNHAVKERKYVARFERFVNGVLNNRESSNLDVVRYSRQFYWGKSLVSMEWLDHVALLMPRVIHINISGGFPYRLSLPDLVFSCASLQHLEMEFCTSKRPIIDPMSIYLPSLKVLRLTGVELLDDIAQVLFMGGFSLEWLDLSYCDLYISSISSMKLKKLSIVACDLFQEMQISCSDLVSLLINSGYPDSDHQERVVGISLKDMTSLVNATINLHGVRYSGDDGDYDDDDDYYYYDVPVLDLFGGLSNVTNLELQLNFPKFKGQMEKDIFSCRNFNNLKKLRIGISNMSCDIHLIACFLKHSPNLKDLTFTLESLLQNPGNTQLECCQEVLGDVSFQHAYLETVEIKCCGNSECANELIKILDNYVKKIGNIIIFE